jgi:hypothetical protein
VQAKNVLLPPAGRAEIIVTTPSASVKSATFRTLTVNTGLIGAYYPTRTLAQYGIGRAAQLPAIAPDIGRVPGPQRFAGIESATVCSQQANAPRRTRPKRVVELALTWKARKPRIHPLSSASLPNSSAAA